MGDLRFTPVSTHGSQAGMKKDLKFTPVLPEGLSSAGMSLRSGLRFTPSVEGLLKRCDDKVLNEYSLDWWTQSSLFQYNALMVSSFYGLEKSNFRDYYNIPQKNFLFIADSGGYQISTQKVTIEPLDILKWMERNADVGTTLDVPPLDMSLKVVGTFENFKQGAELSRRNYEIMYRNWTGKPEMLKVIHGATPEWLDYWIQVTKDFDFDGLAFSPKPLTTETVATVLAYAHNLGVRKVHVFLGTGEEITPLLVYAKKFFDRLTFDSSSFSIAGARYRSYYYPYKLSKTIDFGKQYNSNLDTLPCTCPVCTLSTIKDFNDEGSLPGGLIALHNLYVYLQYYIFLKNLSADRNLYTDFLKDQNLLETIKMLNFLDTSSETDFYTAYKKYFGRQSLEDFFA